MEREKAHDKIADSGIAALGIFLDRETLDPALEEQLCDVMANSLDGWTWHLKQRIVGLTDNQWSRLIRFLKKAGTAQPPHLWYCRLIGELAGDACDLVEANPWKKPGKRLMRELGIKHE